MVIYISWFDLLYRHVRYFLFYNIYKLNQTKTMKQHQNQTFMKKLLIILTILTFFACDSNDDNKDFYMYVNISTYFSVFNVQGDDLLDPENPNHIDTSKIKIFYVINGVKKELTDNPKKYELYTKEQKNINAYSIEVIMNDSEKIKKSITYVQWNEKDTDTIEATYVRDKKNVIYPKEVWLNGTLVTGNTKEYGGSPYVILTK